MISLPLTNERKNTEWQKILFIAENNKFPLHLIQQLKTQIQYKTHTGKTDNKNNKWATFTYHSPKVRKITKIFKQTDIKIASKTRTQYNNKLDRQTMKQHLTTTKAAFTNWYVKPATKPT
jgi:hypothetical protein